MKLKNQNFLYDSLFFVTFILLIGFLTFFAYSLFELIYSNNYTGFFSELFVMYFFFCFIFCFIPIGYVILLSKLNFPLHIRKRLIFIYYLFCGSFFITELIILINLFSQNSFSFNNITDLVYGGCLMVLLSYIYFRSTKLLVAEKKESV